MALISTPPEEPQNFPLPRILCLHGGGSNARIFKAQCRVLTSELSPYFRLVFVEGPFPSEPGPDVTSVYQNFDPYRRWLRSGAHHPHIPAQEVVEEIEDAITMAQSRSDDEGATGEWVGILGFSQGAKTALSLLLRQQIYSQKLGSHFAPSDFRFAVAMAGRAPLVSLDTHLLSDAALMDASQYTPQHLLASATKCKEENMLRLPTVHVHGRQDPGLPLHRGLMKGFCGTGVRLVEWDGGHRVPIKSKDVQAVVKAILDVARETGVIPERNE